MSVEATRSVWRHSQSRGTARLVLLAIADNADDGGLAFPGHEHIAEKCLISRRSVIDNIKGLEGSGELGVRHRRNVGNVYRIMLGELPEIHAKHHQHPRYKCRFCTLPYVNDSASNVQIPASNVKPDVMNVKQGSHEPSEPSLEPSRTAAARKRKKNADCRECGDKPWDCLRCSRYGRRESA